MVRVTSLALKPSLTNWNLVRMETEQDMEPKNLEEKLQSWMAKSKMDCCPSGFARTLDANKKCVTWMEMSRSTNAANQKKSPMSMASKERSEKRLNNLKTIYFSCSS